MRVVRLGLTDFRNYHSCDLSFSPGVTTIVGSNGQGKTNLVEAIHYCATLTSHRIATEAPLIRSGASAAQIKVEIARGDRTQLIEIEINSGRPNRVRVNKTPMPRPREVVGLLRTVVFAPEDLALVKGEPAGRRTFLDDLLVQRRPRLAGVRADYDRVLRQRNSLLKSAIGARAEILATLSVWDDQLLTLATEITSARMRLVDDLRPFFGAAYVQIAGIDGSTELRYTPGVASIESSDQTHIREQLAQALDARQREEITRGLSLVGPHRDELTLEVGGLPVRGYASHGESWSAALALRLAAFELLRSEGAEHEPVLLLDDVFAELDQPRRERLVQVAIEAEQVLVTAAVGADVPGALGGNTVVVNTGQVAQVSMR